MPTYEYACKQCGEHLEVVQSFKDGPLTVCAACGGELKKVFGSIGIVFKGSGFYKTDSRSSSSGTKRSETKAASETAASSKEAGDSKAGASSKESSPSSTPASSASSASSGSSSSSGTTAAAAS